LYNKEKNLIAKKKIKTLNVDKNDPDGLKENIITQTNRSS
tara:strand:- start:721 stop:840 length:120 start_codon:yes stop_codon:yes gene_type:complete